MIYMIYMYVRRKVKSTFSTRMLSTETLRWSMTARNLGYQWDEIILSHLSSSPLGRFGVFKMFDDVFKFLFLPLFFACLSISVIQLYIYTHDSFFNLVAVSIIFYPYDLRSFLHRVSSHVRVSISSLLSRLQKAFIICSPIYIYIWRRERDA